MLLSEKRRPPLTCGHDDKAAHERCSILGALSWDCPECGKTLAWCFACCLGGTAERELREHREACRG